MVEYDSSLVDELVRLTLEELIRAHEKVGDGLVLEEVLVEPPVEVEAVGEVLLLLELEGEDEGISLGALTEPGQRSDPEILFGAGSLAFEDGLVVDEHGVGVGDLVVGLHADLVELARHLLVAADVEARRDVVDNLDFVLELVELVRAEYVGLPELEAVFAEVLAGESEEI